VRVDAVYSRDFILSAASDELITGNTSKSTRSD
jgi:hypothetical protein